jgi:hypothetical protein
MTDLKMWGRHGRNAVDLAGEVFGKLTAVSRAGSDAGNALWLGRCSCGKQTTARADNLISGKAKSCGCARPGRPRKVQPDQQQPSVASTIL